MARIGAEIEGLRLKLEGYGQEHVLAFWSELDQESREGLIRQVGSLDLDLVRELGELGDSAATASCSPAIEPPEIVTLAEVLRGEARAQEAITRGTEELAAGRVGMVLVAGGQASRLGCDGPKGDFPVGPVSGYTLFELHARRILAVTQRFGVRVPWYVMTSAANHKETREIFERSAYFGLPSEDVRLFCQKMLPALDQEGRILLKSKDSLFLAPNGHGGVLEGMASSGCLDDARSRGVRTLSYFQVDNPLARPSDPLFIGLHCLRGAEMSSKVVRKVSADEKVGVLGLVDGRLGCIEYSDMPKDLVNARDAFGELAFSAGNIALHALDLDFVVQITQGELQLPWHVAQKTIPSVDALGRPCAQLGLKFETFVFDALGQAKGSVTLEVDRASEFAPVKNRNGADSPDTARAQMCSLHAGWAARSGLKLPAAGEDGVVPVEVDPLLADDFAAFEASLPRQPLETEEGHLYH